MKISKKQLLNEIRAKDANLSEIAKSHGMTYAGVLKRVKADQELLDAMSESRENLLDAAQSQIGKAVQYGAAWAVKFVLETRGKSRGFSKQAEPPEAEPRARVVLLLPDDGRYTGDPSDCGG